MTIYANKPTPTGRTSGFAISRPSPDHVWRSAEPIIERLHCFGKITDAPPKHLYTKAAGDRDHVGRASSGLTADFELKGELGFSGMRSLLYAFFGNPVTVPELGYGERFELPLSPIMVFTLVHYDGVERFTEVPSCMLTSLTIEAKSDGFFTWSMKGIGDMVRQNEACLNSAVDFDNAVYASDNYADKYVAHDASIDSTVDATYYGRTRLRKVPTPPNLAGTEFAAGDELPWSDFKMTIDLKISGTPTQRRSKGFPAITDISETKIEMTIPTEGDSIDTTHNWADLIDDAFREGGNRLTPQFPIFNKFYMMLVGPVMPSDIYPFLFLIRCPRLSTKCTNPSAAASGLEPVKADMMALRGIAEVPLQIPENSPIYINYQSNEALPPVGMPTNAPFITAPVLFTDVSITGTTAPAEADGVPISLYVDGLQFASGFVAGGFGDWTIAGLDLQLYLTKTITAKAGFGEGKSVASTGVIVT